MRMEEPGTAPPVTAGGLVVARTDLGPRSKLGEGGLSPAGGAEDGAWQNPATSVPIRSYITKPQLQLFIPSSVPAPYQGRHERLPAYVESMCIWLAI